MQDPSSAPPFDASANAPLAPNVLGIEFVEFAARDPAQLGELFQRFGFRRVAVHRHKRVTLFRQADISFLINEEPDSFAARCAMIDLISVCGVALRVQDAAGAMAWADAQGAWRFDLSPSGPMELNIPAVSGIGSAPIYFVDRWRGKNGRRGGIGDISIYDVDFEPIDPAAGERDLYPEGAGLRGVDHITQRVPQGQLNDWIQFYQDLLGFSEVHGPDAQWHVSPGSRVMVSRDHAVRLPLYEQGTASTQQMAHFLGPHQGDGIEHVALASDNILATAESLRARGVEFLHPPAGYYEAVAECLPGHGQDLQALARHGILLDGELKDGKVCSLFLQVFAKPAEGELMFEIVQRQGNAGFGEGNLPILERLG